MALFATRRTLATILRRTLSSPSYSSRLAVSLLNLNYPTQHPNVNPFDIPSPNKNYCTFIGPSPKWTDWPPKGTFKAAGCDYEHWLVSMDFPKEIDPLVEDMIDSYVKTLAMVVGSEEEAKKKIYCVCTTVFSGFGALISEELAFKFKGLPGVLRVIPGMYFDNDNKDYGGDLFVDGKVIRRPQYTFGERVYPGNRTPLRFYKRRETMLVQRREPIPRAQWSPNQQALPHNSTSINGQNVSQGDGGGHRPKQGWFHGQDAPNQAVLPQYPTAVNGQNISQNGGDATLPNQGGFQGKMPEKLLVS